jgi:hypothetical protein
MFCYILTWYKDNQFLVFNIYKIMKYLKLFEDFEPQKSKRQLKSELWHKEKS